MLEAVAATRTDVSKRSRGLILLAGASDVVYNDTLDQTGQTESEQLSYQLDAPFPAADVICSLAEQLVAAGWQPLREDDSRRGVLSSFVEGWQVQVTRAQSSKPVHVDRWHAEWVNASGDYLFFTATYRYPEAGPANRDRLQISAIRTPAGSTDMAPQDIVRRRAAPIVAPGEPARVSPELTCGRGSR